MSSYQLQKGLFSTFDRIIISPGIQFSCLWTVFIYSLGVEWILVASIYIKSYLSDHRELLLSIIYRIRTSPALTAHFISVYVRDASSNQRPCPQSVPNLHSRWNCGCIKRVRKQNSINDEHKLLENVELLVNKTSVRKFKFCYYATSKHTLYKACWASKPPQLQKLSYMSEMPRSYCFHVYV